MHLNHFFLAIFSDEHLKIKAVFFSVTYGIIRICCGFNGYVIIRAALRQFCGQMSSRWLWFLPVYWWHCSKVSDKWVWNTYGIPRPTVEGLKSSKFLCCSHQICVCDTTFLSIWSLNLCSCLRQFACVPTENFKSEWSLWGNVKHINSGSCNLTINV